MIVDDKVAAIELLRWLIRQNCPEITSIASAISVAEALPLIAGFEPDILFLDIQMPKESGFDLLTKVSKWDFEVIFTTAHSEFAIKAIRFSALDYLLKPVNESDLKKAIERYKARKIYTKGGDELYRNFIQNIHAENKPLKLALPGVSEIQYVPIDEIIHLQAERNYTRIYFMNGRNFLSAKTLLEYEKLLHDSGFSRIHKSHLVNNRHINGYDRQGIIKLCDGTELEVSRRKKEATANLFIINPNKTRPG